MHISRYDCWISETLHMLSFLGAGRLRVQPTVRAEACPSERPTPICCVPTLLGQLGGRMWALSWNPGIMQGAAPGLWKFKNDVNVTNKAGRALCWTAHVAFKCTCIHHMQGSSRQRPARKRNKKTAFCRKRKLCTQLCIITNRVAPTKDCSGQQSLQPLMAVHARRFHYWQPHCTARMRD